ncbi:hypothetical protein C8A01DRAFT_31610 [Parachaetomium inaequale]|uniref:Fungal-specific transcription factor domain-containing protein n=1 Tax=Parachaetomium inaequale TaxID=2588326 RepID=A0AAN6PQU5_9PEZI|nr:hypothetical protein C8A01DRAFT_31610 [Parachaetomium inaequale]
MPKIVFVPADGLGSTTAENRKLIRSHCMLGKNKKKYKGKKAPRDHGTVVRQQPRTGASVPHAASAAEIPGDLLGLLGPLHERASPRYSQSSGTTPEVQTPAATEDTFSPLSPLSPFSSPSPPIGIPSVFTFLTFAREIDNRSQDLLFKYFFIARQVFYPIQFCVYSDTSLYTWFEWLFYDAAYLESVLLGMSAMDDFFRRARPSKLTYSHMRATITALNERLSDPDLYLSDSTIAVVMGLAELSGMLADETAAKAHVSGFQRLVRLRGGITSFAGNTKLQIKIGRFDLAYAVSTGKSPQFFRDPISWSPIFEPLSPISYGSSPNLEDADDQSSSSSSSSSPSPSPTRLSPALDFLHEPRIIAVFHDLLQFTLLLNTSSSDPSHHIPLLRDTEYQNYICSIQYRLLRLQGKLGSILDESARLAMLAFLTTTFQVAGQRAPYPHLERRFREFCRATDAEAPSEVTLWLLIVGAMAVFHIDGEDAGWMAELWRAHIPAGWDWAEAHKRLREFPWIAVLHDQAGRAAFEALCRKAQDFDGDMGRLR